MNGLNKMRFDELGEQTCNRCDHTWNYNDLADDEWGCPECRSCQICECCPCNKPTCFECGPNIAYKEIRRQLLNWSISQTGYDGTFEYWRKEPQRLMALLRFERNQAYKFNNNFKYKVIENDQI